MGYRYACVVSVSGNAKCWGDPENLAVLGRGNSIVTSNLVSISPINVGTGKTIKQISLGRSLTCAILNDNRVVCFIEKSKKFI